MGRRWIIYGGISLVVVFGLLAAAYIGYIHIPSIQDQVASKGDLTVRIVSPPSDSNYPADAAIPVLAMAQSAKEITALEYWVDGKLAQSEPPGPGNSPFYVVQTWRWMPLVEGEHLVTVRARSENGSVATSNIVRIQADKAAGYRILYTVKQGDTWDSVAKLCATTVAAIAKQNPLLDPKQSLPPGLQMWIPCNPIFPSAPAAGGSTPPLSEGGPASHAPAPAANLPVWVSQNVSPAATLPAAPALKAGLDGCTVNLLIQDASKDKQGFLVYRSGASNFEQIAELGSNQTGSFTYNDDLQVSGQLQYYVAAFNGAGEADSNIVPVQAAEGTCAPASSSNVAYANGILSVGSGLDLAYLYASLDGGPSDRLPQGEEFFKPTGGKVDLSVYLDPLLKAKPATRAADLEVWGWRGAVIEKLGLLHITFERTTLEYCAAAPDPCTGDINSSKWTNEDGEVGSNLDLATQAVTFQFRANAPGAERVLAQISSQPFTTEYEPNPAYLIEADPITGTASNGSLHGEFTIQFANFNKPKTSGQFVLPPGVLSNLQSIFSPNAPAPPSPFASYLFDQMNLGAFGQQLQSDLFAPTYYIRVIPWEGNGPVGKVSNTIAITYKPIEQKPLPIIAEQPAIFDLKIVRFTGEQNINPDLFGCVTIVSVDEAKLRAALNANISLVVGAEMAKVLEYWDRLGFEELTAQTKAQAIDAAVADAKAKAASGYVQRPSAAPAPEEGGFWGDLWGAIKSSWDLVVETFNQLKGGIVYLMAKFVVEPFTGSCEQTCQDRLMTGLNLAVTYFTGIPPNLPTTDQLIDDGLNYAVNAALEESGVECGGLCKWNIEQGLKATADALKQAGSQPACFPGGENTARYGKSPMCFPDGITVEPIDGASYQPAVAEVQITRNSQAIVTSARQYEYRLLVTSTISNDASVGQTFRCPFGFGYDANHVFMQGYLDLPVPEPAQGTLYPPVDLPVPGNLAAGTPLTLPIILKLPQESIYQYPPYKDKPAICSTRLLTSPGYVITVNAVLMCTDVITKQTAPCPPSQYGSMQDTQQYRP